ncbi:uncharacterized protein LOC117300569 [Asterias rubens]|uniref:uncharacterized protein LOC117300569 n=1 Tax=Asterias rubens TaxID=7604 RepID=UPI00145522C3|nr:uncharacterized protein LOC117300569 [Asterias rubens]
MTYLFTMRLMMLCVVSLCLYGELSASRHTKNFEVADNVTVTLCRDLHLCQNIGCGTSWIKNSVCQCDWACEFFDDCCLDIASVCSIDSSDVLDSLKKPQFECISVTRDLWMVSHCPYAAEVSPTYAQTHENCESTDNTNPLTLIPVTDASGITFRNIYCALCHGRSTSNLVPWELKATCPKPIHQNTSYAVFLRKVWNECDHYLELPAVDVSGPATRRPCIPSLITTCQQHHPHSQSLLSSCQNFTAVVKFRDDGSLYRNPACFAACKGSSHNYSLECPTSASQLSSDQIFPTFIQIVPKTSDDLIPVSAFFPRFTHFSVSLSVILNFNPTDGSPDQCSEGDFFDPFSQTCLSPQCEEGLEYVATEQRCEPLNNQPQSKPANDNSFLCIGDSHQGPGILLMITTSSETTNLTSNSPNTETGYENKKRCIRDLLGVNLTSVQEDDDPYSGNSSQFAFKILVKLQTNNTEIDTSISRRQAIGYLVEDIETKLESVETDESQCGLQSLQLVQYCNGKEGTPYGVTLCSSSHADWLPLENETQVRVNNQTVWAFDASHNAWYKLQEYNLRIQYSKHGSVFTKLRLEIGLCSRAPNNSCPAFIKLNESQFSLVDEDTEDFENYANGSLIFLQTEEILGPDEFTRTEDGQISICASKLPQNGTRFFNFNNAQNILSTVGFIISVAAGSVSLVTYLVFPSLHGRTRKAIMGMVTSLIAAQTLLLLGGVAAANGKACMAVAVTGHFLWLASLTWTNVLAFLLWHTFATKNPSPSSSKIAVTSKINILSCSYALGIPLAIVIVCLIIHFCSCTDIAVVYNNDAHCWIQSGPINLVVFGAPMALFLVINIILFTRTVWAIRSSHRRSAAQFNQGRDTSFLKRRSKELFIYVRMASLMGFTWVFGFSAAFSGAEALWYLFIILNSLQGFFIFLSFTFNYQVKELWKKKLIPIRDSMINKTSVLASRGMNRTTTSTISAGIALSDVSSSNDYQSTSTSNNNNYETSSETSSRFKMALRRLKEKYTQPSEQDTDKRQTKPPIPVKEDVQGSLPFSPAFRASSEYEEVIPGRCLKKRDDKTRFWHKLSLHPPKPTTPSLKTAENVRTANDGPTGSLAGPSRYRASSAYEEVIPGRCLRADHTQDGPTSSKSTEDASKSKSEVHPHGTGTEIQLPKIPLLPFKIPRHSKTSVSQNNNHCVHPVKNVDEDATIPVKQLPSRRPIHSLEKEPETEANCKVRLDKPPITPHSNLQCKTGNAQTKERSYLNPINHAKSSCTNPLPLLTPKPSLNPKPPLNPKPSLTPKPPLMTPKPQLQESTNGDHSKLEVTMNASRYKVPVLPLFSSFPKRDDSASTPTGNPNLVETPDIKTDTNMNPTQNTLPSVKQPPPPRPKPRNTHESRDESGWHDVIGQIEGQSMLKSK